MTTNTKVNFAYEVSYENGQRDSVGHFNISGGWKSVHYLQEKFKIKLSVSSILKPNSKRAFLLNPEEWEEIYLNEITPFGKSLILSQKSQITDVHLIVQRTK